MVEVLTSAERSRQMGHQNDSTFSFYISRIAPVDIQNIMNDKEPDQLLVDYLRSMRAHMDVAAPRPAGGSLVDDRYYLANSWQETIQKKVTGCAQGIYNGSREAVPFTKISRPPASRFLRTCLVYDRPRSRLLTMFQETPAVDVAVLPEIVSLYVESIQSSKWYYPETAQVASCPCGKASEGSDVIGYGLHLLSCFQTRKVAELEDMLLQ